MRVDIKKVQALKEPLLQTWAPTIDNFIHETSIIREALKAPTSTQVKAREEEHLHAFLYH